MRTARCRAEARNEHLAERRKGNLWFDAMVGQLEVNMGSADPGRAVAHIRQLLQSSRARVPYPGPCCPRACEDHRSVARSMILRATGILITPPRRSAGGRLTASLRSVADTGDRPSSRCHAIPVKFENPL
jgi:hypothetical protein